jgi:geranyl-CoA carboxylase beta subunit
MPLLESNLDTSSPAFAANREAWLKLIADFRALEQRVRDASAKAKPVFDRRGQLLPRERVARALDAGSPFLELATVAGWCLDNPDPAKTIPGGGLVAGIGTVSGVRCMVAASDSGIDAGAIQPMGLEKIQRVLEIAKENRLPF